MADGGAMESEKHEEECRNVQAIGFADESRPDTSSRIESDEKGAETGLYEKPGMRDEHEPGACRNRRSSQRFADESVSDSSARSSRIESGEQGGVYKKLGWRSVRALRVLVVITLVLHLGISALAMAVAVASSSSGCPRSLVSAAAIVASGACIRIAWVIGTGLCQAATAVTMIAEEHVPASQNRFPASPATVATKIQRRMWYKRWLWWGRFGAIVTFLQVSGACYLSFLAIRNARSSFCFSGSSSQALLQDTLVILPVTTWLLVFAQCCVGSDVLSWRSLYEMQNEAWRAHYREMFDHGIREILCCLGRSRYMSKMDGDEVGSVAALLGDLVAYRAAGASHLEFLAGIALLRTRRSKSPLPIDFPPAPQPMMKEAAVLHPYAVAAYTGPLLDIGRNLFFFPCAWVYRQGLFTIWNRRKRPKLDGDNWWRGHAAAFLGAARVPPEALLKGRVHQRNRETVYFVIELKDIKCVVVAIRGTETPEDLLTDGLGRECFLSESDIQGLLLSGSLSDTMKQEQFSATPRYGHAGVVAAARELAFELDSPEDCPPEYDQTGESRKKIGFLSAILGPGGRCEGYSLRFVGHSLGGSIAALAGMMLWHRFPNLHVYGYGVLPCVDAVIAEACSGFVTSIVYNDEFSSRLSVASLMRLRAAALRALAEDSDADSAVIARLARRLFVSRRICMKPRANDMSINSDNEHVPHQQYRRRRLENKIKGGAFLCYHACHCVMGMPKDSDINSSTVMGMPVVCSGMENNHIAEEEVGKEKDEEVGLMEDEGGEECIRGLVNGELLNNGMPSETESDMVGFKPGSDLQEMWPVELVMPGLVIHLIRNSSGFVGTSVNQSRSSAGFSGFSGSSRGSFVNSSRSWSSWGSSLSARFSRGSAGRRRQHRAILQDRDSFRDIVVSPSMFLDHMPWRCQKALNDVLEEITEETEPRTVDSMV